jgi:hypothetical protein
MAPCSVAQYKTQIHQAVARGGHLDFYTGEVLDWSLVSTFKNEEAKAGTGLYKKRFAMLPTVDHTVDENGKLKFVICSWKLNDAKSDLTLEEFYELCEKVLKNRRQQ